MSSNRSISNGSSPISTGFFNPSPEVVSGDNDYINGVQRNFEEKIAELQKDLNSFQRQVENYRFISTVMPSNSSIILEKLAELHQGFISLQRQIEHYRFISTVITSNSPSTFPDPRFIFLPREPLPTISQDSYDLLIAVIKNIPINTRDIKVLNAIQTLKQMISKLSYVKPIDDNNTTLKSLLRFQSDSKNIILKVYLELSNTKITKSKIKNTSCVDFLIEILYLLSSEQSLSSETKNTFLLLYNAFNSPDPNRLLKTIISMQGISNEVNESRGREALIGLHSIDKPVAFHPKKRRTTTGGSSSLSSKQPRAEQQRKEKDEYLLNGTESLQQDLYRQRSKANGIKRKRDRNNS